MCDKKDKRCLLQGRITRQKHKTESQRGIDKGREKQKETDTIGDFPFLTISGTSQDIVRQNKCPCPVDMKGHMKDPII